jgi:hypothetical protein
VFIIIEIHVEIVNVMMVRTVTLASMLSKWKNSEVVSTVLWEKTIKDFSNNEILIV